MRDVSYKVIEEFDEKRDYSVKIQKRFISGLKIFKKGEEFFPKDIIDRFVENPPTKLKINRPNMAQFVYSMLNLAKKIGLMERNEKYDTMDFKEFSQKKTVIHWMSNLREPKTKHIEISNFKDSSASQYNMRRKLFLFDLWLKQDRIIKVNYWKNTSVDVDGNIVAKRITEDVKIKDVEHLLELKKKSGMDSDEEFQMLFHTYLIDPLHSGKMASSVQVDKVCIESYFSHNYSKLNIHFNPKKKYRVNTQTKGERTSLTLEDLFVLLTDGNPTLMEKTAFVCKFQRGLDNSTFVDGFNFEAWEQLVEYFGTTDFESWDESKCPVPIEIVRVKTQFNHIGFLDVDAIKLVKKWLKKREEITGKPIQKGEPMFLNQKGYAIKDDTFTRGIRKLAKNAKLDKKLTGYERSNRYEQNSHELRDLLNTTLDVFGAGSYLAEHVIGHKQKSNYTKSEQLYLEKMRVNFSKASEAINIFSKVSNFIKNGGDERITQLEQKVEALTKSNISLKKERIDIEKKSANSQESNKHEDIDRQRQLERLQIIAENTIKENERLRKDFEDLKKQLKK